MSKRRNQRAVHAPAWAAPLLTMWQKCGLAVLAVLYFLIVCLLSTSTVKAVTLLLIFASIAAVFLAFSRLRSRLNLPLAALTLVVLMDGISTFYAISGKFALYEFLKILCAFCLTMIVLAVAPGQGMEGGRWIASILEGFVALAALVSVDMISTHYISDLILFLLSKITPNYLELEPLVPGTRINSIFTNPNVFAGIAGIGVILSLGLVLSSAGRPYLLSGRDLSGFRAGVQYGRQRYHRSGLSGLSGSGEPGAPPPSVSAHGGDAGCDAALCHGDFYHLLRRMGSPTTHSTGVRHSECGSPAGTRSWGQWKTVQ